MSNNRDKEAYREDLRRIEQHLRNAGCDPSVVRVIDRYSGELRRSNSALRQRLEATEAELGGATRRLQTLLPLPGQLEDLQRNFRRLEQTNRELQDRNESLQGEVTALHEMLERSGVPHFSDSSDFCLVKAKCLKCSLHFIVCTEESSRHSAATLYCPECGQHSGTYIVWDEPGRGFVFQHVPGHAQLREIRTEGLSPRGPTWRCRRTEQA